MAELSPALCAWGNNSGTDELFLCKPVSTFCEISIHYETAYIHVHISRHTKNKHRYTHAYVPRLVMAREQPKDQRFAALGVDEDVKEIVDQLLSDLPEELHMKHDEATTEMDRMLWVMSVIDGRPFRTWRLGMFTVPRMPRSLRPVIQGHGTQEDDDTIDTRTFDSAEAAAYLTKEMPYPKGMGDHMYILQPHDDGKNGQDKDSIQYLMNTNTLYKLVPGP